MVNGNNISIDLDQSEYLRAKIKVIGVGGGGCNAIDNMISGNLEGVELIAANTDSQALNENKSRKKIQLGLRTTKGLGAGSDPEIGRKAAEESEQDILEAIKDAEMVFVTCGMGGGTGTGAAPVVARIAKDAQALVVGIVTRPFDYEGEVRKQNAEIGIQELRKNVDAFIVIPNEKIYEIIGDDTDCDEALLQIDQILFNSTRGISDIINRAGRFNVDFADVRTIMKDKGMALMGIGSAEGPNRASEAAVNAITSPLLDGISIKGAKGLLVNITGGQKIRQSEIKTILDTIRQQTGNNINLIHGIVKSDEDTDVLNVTVIATGFENKHEEVKTTTRFIEPIFNPMPPKHTPVRTSPFQTNMTAGEVAEKYKTNTFTNQKPNGQDVSIPRGHDIRTFDTPAFIRNGGEEYDNNDNSISTVFPEIISEEPSITEAEEIKLENIQTGFDFMNLPQNNNGNYFTKMRY